MKRAGSFSGGECCHLSKGFSSSQGFSGSGMSIAGVVGRRLGDSQTRGLGLCAVFALRLALASQLAICIGFNSVCLSSSAFSSSVGYGWLWCTSSHSRRILTACRGKRIPLRFVLPGASSPLGVTVPLARLCRVLMPVSLPVSLQESSSTECSVSKNTPLASLV